MAAASQPTAETLLATATAYFAAVSKLDHGGLLSLMTDDYKHEIAPASADFGPPTDGPTFAARFGQLAIVLDGYTTTVTRSWPNPTGASITVQVKSDAAFKASVKGDDGDEAWEFKSEYVFVMEMDPEGRKIRYVLEFVDSKKTDKMKELVTAAFGKVAA